MCQAFIAETVETGKKIVASPKSRTFREESLGKIKFRAFPKSVGPRILSRDGPSSLSVLEARGSFFLLCPPPTLSPKERTPDRRFNSQFLVEAFKKKN